MIPNPSHPNIMVIKFGDKMNLIIERMNKETSRVNRLMFCSPVIYDLENVNTLNEINVTVVMNMVLIGLIITGKDMVAELM